MAEFALTLPILLLLMFGVIEFARIFHAWITLQNAARAAARYAVTGRWDENSVASAIGYSSSLTDPLDRRRDILDALVPCTDGFDQLFYDHWGKDCDPNNDDDRGLRYDMARLPSIIERARIGAASLALAAGERIQGLQNPFTLDWVNTETVGEDQPGWFHVFICSSRESLYRTDPVTGLRPPRYIPSENRNDRICRLDEAPDPTLNQYDAGGPGDAVEIIVFFNHPLITPLGLADYIQLQARRVMINESFRSTRLVNLPPQLGAPTRPPTLTFTPSLSPTASDTPTNTPSPTATATNTPVDTPVPTQRPDCSLIQLTNVSLSNNYLRMTVRNSNATAPVFITRATVEWRKHTLFSNMYLDVMRLQSRAAFWDGADYNPPTDVYSGVPGWIDGISPYNDRRLDAGTSVTFQAEFLNGPANLSSYFTIGSFAGTKIYFGTEWGGVNQDCVLEITGYPTPTPYTLTPTYTPTPVCANYLTQFIGFDLNGVVHFTITNTDVAVAYLTGFSINWNSYNQSRKAIALDFVSAGGTSAHDARAVLVWDGNITSPPGVASQGSAGWQTSPVIEPGRTLDVWFDFDGTSKRLSEEGYIPSDFNNTTFTINFICYGEAPNVPTPAPTQPPTPRPTATNTRTPTITYTPSITLTPSRTPTPSITPTPSNTRTPTRTPTPVTPVATFGGVE